MNNQQPKPDPKGKAIASLILGFVSVILVFYFISSIFTSLTYYLPETLDMWLYSSIWFVTPLAGLIGIFLGGRCLTSTRSNFAKWGIMLSALSLLFFVFLILFIGLMNFMGGLRFMH